MAIGVVVVAIATVISVGVLYAHRDRNRGLDTTCRDLMKMTHAARQAVMEKAGVAKGDRDEVISYYLGDCRQHPEDGPYPIGNIRG